MLRFDYMASDFNPHFLILGSRDELESLAGLLRDYAEDAMPMDLLERYPNPAAKAAVLLEPVRDAEQGMHEVGESEFRWGLQGWQASVIADSIDKLTTDRSGSEIFQVGTEGEIAVKVSHGEFTDDFLVTKR